MPPTPTARVVSGMRQAERRIRLNDPLNTSATPSTRKGETWVSCELKSARVLQIRIVTRASRVEVNEVSLDGRIGG